MKKYIFGLLAIAFAVGAVAFTKPAPKSSDMATIYFEFTGTINSQEGDRTKWDEITQTVYNALSCPGTKLGCKLIATEKLADGHPREVYLVSGTKNPTTGTYVSTVVNLQN